VAASLRWLLLPGRRVRFRQRLDGGLDVVDSLLRLSPFDVESRGAPPPPAAEAPALAGGWVISVALSCHRSVVFSCQNTVREHEAESEILIAFQARGCVRGLKALVVVARWNLG